MKRTPAEQKSPAFLKLQEGKYASKCGGAKPNTGPLGASRHFVKLAKVPWVLVAKKLSWIV